MITGKYQAFVIPGIIAAIFILAIYAAVPLIF